MTALNPWDISSAQSSNDSFAINARMPIQDVDANQHVFSMPPVVDAVEAERLIESLRVFPIEEVGSYAWMEQHRHLERLNIQAHQCAMTNSDDYITEGLLTFQKLTVIIEELIIIEAWKEFVYPLVVKTLARKNAMRLYFVLYHEATLANLLEVVMYHKHAVRSAGDKWLEIVDYVARKLARVNGGYDFRSLNPSSGASTGASAKDIAEAIANRTPEEEIAQHFSEIEFRLCISACFLARFLCEHIDVLPIAVHSRITDTHDFLVLIIPCIENPPWTRRIAATGKWQKVIDFKWTEVAPIDLLKVTKLEGQLWISLYYLISKREFRERYLLNSFRTAQLLRVRKYLNDTLLDQLPMLSDIQRYMDELTIADATGGGAANRSALDASSLSANAFTMLQQVAVVRDRLIRGSKWDVIAAHALEMVFIMTDATDRDLKLIADVYADDLAEDVLEPLPSAGAGPGGDYEDM